MKRTLCIVCLLGGVLAGGASFTSPAAEEVDDDEAVKAFMHAKLDAAQKVLEGLVTERFGVIRQGADRMLVMSRSAEWHVHKTPAYAQHSAEFQNAAERVKKAAREEELDAASLAYLQLTMSCINCHKYARSIKIAQNDRIDSRFDQIARAATLTGENR